MHKWFALALVALLGVIELPRPFCWDQSTFALGARALSEGAVLYRDFWDLKQPGIYFFYLAGGQLFGFHEAGIHLFELLYWLAFSAMLLYAMRERFRSNWALATAPLLTVGMYYAHTGGWHLTQVEALVGAPMFFTLLYASLVSDDPAYRRLHALLAGIAGGICLVFKLVFAPLVIALWLPGLAQQNRVHGGRAASTFVIMLIGLLFPIAVVVLWFAARGALDELWTVTFLDPLHVAAVGGEFHYRTLLAGASWFLPRWAPLIALGFFGILVRLSRRYDPFDAGLVVWLVMGTVTILAQRLSLWTYHFMLFVVPLGIMAAQGLDELLGSFRRLEPSGTLRPRWLLVAGTCASLFLWPLGVVAMKATYVVHGVQQQMARRTPVRFYEAGELAELEGARSDVAFLSVAGAQPGSIFVIGNPLYHWESGRPLAIPRLGGLLTTLCTRRDWAAMSEQLSRARPAYIFVADDKATFMTAHANEVAPFFDFLSGSYVLDHATSAGTWYVHVDHAARP